jgi:ABC-2 type transport system permease protein
VTRREYLERVRSRAFLFATFLGPLLMAAVVLLPTAVMSRQRGKLLKLAVFDASGTLRAPVEEALARTRAEGQPRFQLSRAEGSSEDELKAAVLAGRLDGYLHLPADALERSVAEYYGRNVSNVLDLRLMDRAVEGALVAQRLTAEGLDPGRVESLVRPLDLKTIRLSAAGAREDRGGSFLFSMLLVMMLYTTVLLWGQAVVTSVIEEKSSRVVEVMVSSVPASTLLAGKLLGVGGAGLTQFLVWAVSIAVASAYGAGLAGGALPEVTPLLLGAFALFFLLGFFLYAALYAAIGAAVNTIQEAQGLAYPVLMPLILGVMFFPAILQSPDSALSVTLSLIPLLTPLTMFLRIAVLPPPAWQVALSIGLTLATVAATTWAAARIYRVGILMYGKKPTFQEIMRWVRSG